MSITIVIILCVLIALVLILFPLAVSRNAEIASKKSEWDKIKDYEDKINNKSNKEK
tara:strand:- start:2140 stop:2307 length:168 start_codon:yes stop_codon:yes gene_type:complete